MKHMIRNTGAYALVCTACLLWYANVNAQNDADAIDWIVATAGNGVVLNSELEAQTESTRRIIKERKLEQMDEERMRAESLEYLILQELQLQMGERAGVVFDEEEISESLQKIAERQNLSVREFHKKLIDSGTSIEQYRKLLHKRLIVEEVQRGSMRSRIQVTNQEIAQFLKSNEGESIKLGQYQLLHIHLPFNTDDADAGSQESVRKCIKALQDAVEREGPEGVESLRDHKTCNTRYYNLGWVAFEDVPSIFEEILPVLEIHTLSKELLAGNGIHFAWLNDKRGGERQMVTQHLVSHILVIPSIVRPQASVQRELDEIYEQLLDGADFSEMALDFSEDPGSKLKGGDLGWLSQGDTDPVFESVVSQTAINQVSAPFETQYGWHILTVREKREHNMAPLMIRRHAKNILYGRKYNQELDNWLSKIRSESHVQIR